MVPRIHRGRALPAHWGHPFAFLTQKLVCYTTAKMAAVATISIFSYVESRKRVHLRELHIVYWCDGAGIGMPRERS